MLVNTPVPIMFAITIAAVMPRPSCRFGGVTRDRSRACGDRGTRAHRASSGAQPGPRPARETHESRRGNNALRTGTSSARERLFEAARVVEQRITRADRCEERRQRRARTCSRREARPAASSMTRSGSASSVAGPARADGHGGTTRRVAEHSVDPARQLAALRESLGTATPRASRRTAARARHDAAVVDLARPRLGARLARRERQRGDQVAARRLARDRDAIRIAAELARCARPSTVRRAGVLDRRRDTDASARAGS